MRRERINVQTDLYAADGVAAGLTFHPASTWHRVRDGGGGLLKETFAISRDMAAPFLR